MEIRREAYLNQLIERRDNGMIKIVTGIRRCRKSYLLFTIFKQYREALGLTQSEFAEKAGFTVNYISTIERGTAFPSCERIISLLNTLVGRCRFL